jgi:hypothetical protein
MTWEPGQLIAGDSGEPFRVQLDHRDRIVFVPLLPIGEWQHEAPKGARLLTRAEQ